MCIMSRYSFIECGKLRTILLKNVKRVSDVGVRFLAIGCPDLEYVNGEYRYMNK